MCTKYCHVTGSSSKSVHSWSVRIGIGRQCMMHWKARIAEGSLFQHVPCIWEELSLNVGYVITYPY